jgi:diacylglycerol O-acyltransferase
MGRIKASPEAKVTFGILGASGVAGSAIERSVIDVFTRKGSLLVTNVSGPPVPLAIAGRALESIVVWAPTAGHIALGVTFVSYAGAMRVGVVSDPAIVADPQVIVTEIERDLDALLHAVSKREVGPALQTPNG